MRYVLRPEPLRVGPSEFGLGHFLMYYVDQSVRFLAGQSGIRAGVRIAEAIRVFEGSQESEAPTEPEGYLALEEADWQALKDEMEAPRLMKAGEVEAPPFPISPARNCVRFLDALAQAKTEKPKCAPAGCATENAKAANGTRKRGKPAEPGAPAAET